MASNAVLQPVRTQGWRMGFANLFRKESGEWFGTRTWLVQALIWAAIINGMLLATFSIPEENADGRATVREAATEASGQDASSAELAAPIGITLLAVMGGMATGVGAVIIMQGALLDERQNGTAAWVLSKPLSRVAFILAKLLANTLGMLVIMIALQGLIAWLLFALNGQVMPPGDFILGFALLGLHLLFYVTLTLMLGVLSNNRGVVIGIPLGLLFGYQAVAGLIPALVPFMPWTIAVPLGNGLSLAMQALMGQPITNWTPVVATALWCVLFSAVALWRFRQEEF